MVFPVQNFINAVTIGFSIGVNAVISYFLGAQEQEKANSAASQGLLLSAIHGVILTVGCIAAMPAFLRMFTDDELVISLGPALLQHRLCLCRRHCPWVCALRRSIRPWAR